MRSVVGQDFYFSKEKKKLEYENYFDMFFFT
jgi:hypothetical protein